MITCCECGKEFHICGSCSDAGTNWAWYFCSAFCMEKAREKTYARLQAEYNLTKEQLEEILLETDDFRY